MALSIVQSASSGEQYYPGNTGSENIGVTMPSAPTAGNMLVAVIGGLGTLDTGSSGYTALAGSAGVIGWRIAGASEPTTQTVMTLGPHARGVAVVYEITGFASPSPGAANFTSIPGSTTNGWTSSGTVTLGNTKSNGAIAFLYFFSVNGGSGPLIVPTGYTTDYSATGVYDYGFFHDVITAPGTNPSGTLGYTGDTGGVAYGVVLEMSSVFDTITATDTAATETDSVSAQVIRNITATDTAATESDNAIVTATFPVNAPRHFWRILIFDRNNNLVDIPQDDIEEWSFKCVLNGGSAAGQLIFVRDFNKVGALAPGYQVLIWMWTEGTTMPTDPYYSGILIDELDQEQLDARGRITANLKGDSALLDAAIVTSTVTGGIGGATPMPDAAVYLQVLADTYQPPSFIAPSIPSSMFQLWPVQFDGTALSACIDTVVKQSVDSNNHTFIWFVKTNRLLQRQLVIESDLNPNWNTNAPPFSMQFPGITLDSYEIQNIYRNIVNTISIYGGNDPSTGLQAFYVADDATSIAEYGAFEAKLSVPGLISSAACQSYAQVYLAQNAYPSANGTARLLNPDPTITIGHWVQFNETPAATGQEAIVKQVRITEIDVQCVGQRVEQKLLTSSPTPYLDEAIYRLGLNVKASVAGTMKVITTNRQLQYVVNGGLVAAVSASPAKVSISACICTFASGQVTIAAVASAQVQDSTTSATGDGDYTIYANSGGTFTMVKGFPANPTATTQMIARVAVLAGTAYVTDARVLMAAPSLNPSTTLVASSVVLGTPANTGSGAYDQPISFNLATPAGGLANPSLAGVQLGWLAVGGTSPIAPTGQVLPPTVSGAYSSTILGIGSGTEAEIYVQGVDTHGITTGWTYLGLSSSNNFNVGTGVTGQLPYSNNTPGTISGLSANTGAQKNSALSYIAATANVGPTDDTLMQTATVTLPSGGTWTLLLELVIAGQSSAIYHIVGVRVYYTINGTNYGPILHSGWVVYNGSTYILPPLTFPTYASGAPGGSTVTVSIYTYLPNTSGGDYAALQIGTMLLIRTGD